MQAKKSWAFQSLFSCLIFNSILLVVLFIMAKRILGALSRWVDPFLAQGNTNLPADAQSAFAGLSRLITETDQYLAPVVLGGGMVFTLGLWLLLRHQGRRLLEQTEPARPSPTPPVSKTVAEETAVKHTVQPPALQSQQPPQASPQAAVQMLAILQREGRLVDFLRENLHSYSDDQIGAAVRSIHQGCQAALQEHIELKPIFEELEGAHVTVPPHFDSKAIRLTGNVIGDPPFEGTLRHHGWRVVRIELPQLTSPQEKDWILAPAEVEIAE
ncbi:MAG TPA: DUF2760 domain-containing protein [Syntrophobacteraceae bacterium]|nr:DUF2760 domain-containing protein [Syntrophobacteraceae bacterium]